VDPSGRRVDETTGAGTGSQQRPPSAFSVEVAARPGSYFVSLEAAGQRLVRRLVVLGQPATPR